MMTIYGTYARSRMINLLFLLCFIIYAMSPLIHPGIAGRGVPNAGGQAGERTSGGGVSILLLDLLFLNLVHAPDSSAPSSVTLSFVRKAGGVLSGDAFRLISDAAGIPVKQGVSPVVSAPLSREGKSSGLAGSCRGYNPLYSANSPPLHRCV